MFEYKVDPNQIYLALWFFFNYYSLVKLHCNFFIVYVLYIGIDNSSQGPTLGSDKWSVKVERDENYVWIYYNIAFVDLPLLFTSANTMMIKIYVTI